MYGVVPVFMCQRAFQIAPLLSQYILNVPFVLL
jgi:hypothetical protein